jgi:predicted ArsR family transcriptional regulator
MSERIEVLAALAEPVRRRLYQFVLSARPGEVTRDQAAEAMGVKRGLAAFHLDKLVEVGLLDVRYQRLHERTGPGAGRPSKLYRPSTVEIEVSFPPRRYGLAARLLLRAFGAAGEEAALARAAREHGLDVGRTARAAVAEAAAPREVEEAVLHELERQGFDPEAAPEGDVRLRNCPFDALVAEHRSTVCAMNLALMEGAVEGARAGSLMPRLRPDPGRRCCVVLERGGASGR